MHDSRNTLKLLMATLLAVPMLLAPLPADAADPTTSDFGTHFVETVANGVFVKAGYDQIQGVTHTVTARATNLDGGVIVNADYTFTVDQHTFTGSGSYSYGESNGVETIDVDLYLANSDGTRTLDFDYTSVNDLAADVLDEDLSVTHSGASPSSIVIDKTQTVTVQGSTETDTITASYTVDGTTTNVTVTEDTTDLGGGSFARSAVYQASSAAFDSYVDTDYSLSLDASDQMTAVFSRYDLTVNGVTYSLDPGVSSYLTTTRLDADTYDLDYRLRLLDATGDPSTVTASGTIALARTRSATTQNLLQPLSGGDDGWDWSDFGKSIATGAAGGAAGGAVTGAISTDSAAPAGAGAGAAVGAVAGAAAGGVTYAVGKAWDWAFGDDDDDADEEPVEEEPKEVDDQLATKALTAPAVSVQPVPRQQSFASATFFNGHTDFTTCDFDAVSTTTD